MRGQTLAPVTGPLTLTNGLEVRDNSTFDARDTSGIASAEVQVDDQVSGIDGGAMYVATNGTWDATIVAGPGSGDDAGKTSISMAVNPAKKK